jgi:membrane associated rhomboid family serine protease
MPLQREPHIAPSKPPRNWKGRLKRQAALLVALVILTWVVAIVDQLFLASDLHRWGIRPRSVEGLRGIVLAPFLHGDLAHVAANTMPFLVLGWLVLLRGLGEFLKVTLFTVALSGLVVWLIGRSSTVHVGASSLIFGYLGYLMLRGYFDRSAFSVVVSVLVGLGYGGLIWGLLPTAQEHSWEGHLGGFLAGAGCAWLFTRQPRTLLEIRV